MKAKLQSKLRAIEMENFQAFTDKVRIKFSPITLFFGPNSAGKSAVFDALELVRKVWDPKGWDKREINQLLLR